MNNIDAAIFDMDGLLIDSERVCLACFEQSCNQFGLYDKPHNGVNAREEMRQLYLSCLGTNAAENNRRMQAALQERVNVEQLLQHISQGYRQYTSEHAIPLKAGVLSLLDALDSRDIPAAVATSTPSLQAIDKLEKCDLRHRFKSITGGDQVSNSKPSPDIFLQAARSINATPARCLAFEDSGNGVRAAVAAGMQVFQVPDLQQPDQALLALGHTVVASLEDVEQLVWGE